MQNNHVSTPQYLACVVANYCPREAPTRFLWLLLAMDTLAGAMIHALTDPFLLLLLKPPPPQVANLSPARGSAMQSPSRRAARVQSTTTTATGGGTTATRTAFTYQSRRGFRQRRAPHGTGRGTDRGRTLTAPPPQHRRHGRSGWRGMARLVTWSSAARRAEATTAKASRNAPRRTRWPNAKTQATSRTARA